MWFASLSCFILTERSHHGRATRLSIAFCTRRGEGPTLSTVRMSIAGSRNFWTTGCSFGSVEILRAPYLQSNESSVGSLL